MKRLPSSFAPARSLAWALRRKGPRDDPESGDTGGRLSPTAIRAVLRSSSDRSGCLWASYKTLRRVCKGERLAYCGAESEVQGTSLLSVSEKALQPSWALPSTTPILSAG